jgi:hypothetical protein
LAAGFGAAFLAATFLAAGFGATFLATGFAAVFLTLAVTTIFGASAKPSLISSLIASLVSIAIFTEFWALSSTFSDNSLYKLDCKFIRSVTEVALPTVLAFLTPPSIQLDTISICNFVNCFIDLVLSAFIFLRESFAFLLKWDHCFIKSFCIFTAPFIYKVLILY